jgi:hypothetical protein
MVAFVNATTLTNLQQDDACSTVSRLAAAGAAC